MTAAERSQRPVWLGEDERGWDHVRVHVQLLKDTRLGADDLAVYLGIAAHAELVSGRAYPAAMTLAKYANISERQVRYCIERMAQAGYLRVTHQAGKASVYTLLRPPPLASKHQVPRQEVPGSNGAQPRQEVPDTPAGGADEQEPRTRGTTTPPKSPPAGGRTRTRDANIDATMVDPDFLRFYDAYPLKKGKRAAAGAWRSALKRGKTVDELMEAVVAFAATVTDKTYVPHPSTWLNQGRYDDEPESNGRSGPRATGLAGTGPRRTEVVKL